MLVLVFILGLAFGSFLNAYIWRLKNGKSVWSGRSVCTGCRKTLRAAELIPLISFIIQKGKCRHCHGSISWQYPVVELAAALLFTGVTYLRLGTVFSPDFMTLVIWVRDLFLALTLLAIFVFDLRYYIIPDQLTIPAIILVMLANFYLGFGLDSMLLGVLTGFAFFGLQFAVSRGKWVGGGDLRMGALMGAALGWPLVVVSLFISYFSGSLVALFLLSIGRKGWKSQLPFGTFLSAATFVTIFYGQQILNWYLGLIRL